MKDCCFNNHIKVGREKGKVIYRCEKCGNEFTDDEWFRELVERRDRGVIE